MTREKTDHVPQRWDIWGKESNQIESVFRKWLNPSPGATHLLL